MSHHKKPVQPVPPRDKLFLRAGSLNDPKCTSVLNKAVARQPFLSRMDLLLSTNSTTPELPTEIKQLIEQHTFSHARINPAELLCPSLMTGYIRANNGSLVLISASDTAENTLAMDGKGHLILSVSKDTHSTLGIPGHVSHFGPKGDRYYIEIDLKPDFMRSGKPGYERLRTSLRKLGEMDLIATFVDHEGIPRKVHFPATASSISILRPKVTCNLHKLSSKSELTTSRETLNEHDFNSEKTRKRKRDANLLSAAANTEQEDSGILIQDILEAVGSVGIESPQNTGIADMMSISIEGLLHPTLVQKLLTLLTSSKPLQLISLTAQTISNSPIERQLKRENMTPRTKGRVNGKEERSIEDGRVLDGWSVIIGAPEADKTRFVYVDSASS